LLLAILFAERMIVANSIQMHSLLNHDTAHYKNAIDEPTENREISPPDASSGREPHESHPNPRPIRRGRLRAGGTSRPAARARPSRPEDERFSINYRDLLVVNGVGRWRPPIPRIPLSDGVGIVTATGEGVSRVKVGDRVAPIFYPQWLEGRVAAEKMSRSLGGAAADGVLAEYTLVDQASLVHVPSHLTDEQAATLPCAGVTAWSALRSFGAIRPGDSVVVLGTGGVALFVLQFARLLGARVIVTSSSEHKLARAKALGAAAGIHYTLTRDWPGAVVVFGGITHADNSCLHPRFCAHHAPIQFLVY
jgi:hypothetical protein